jgi:NAD(P)-dependent dehydrogenase (short-subunit alcohol dehydrogenase family)/3-oxoacyl-(acyl-carrier-protein) synthase
MIDLRGRLALVTGGGRGVGRVIAHRLAEAGAEVIINCFHSYAAAKSVHAELTEKGATAHIIRASVARREQVDRMFDEVARDHGRLDILVNNAASGRLVPNDELDEDDFAKAYETNLLGSFWCARRAADLMPSGGAIVNLSSVGAGFVPDNYLSVGTSKAAIEALTRHLAADYAERGIRVNTASCGLIEGEVADLFPDAEGMQQVTVAHTPLGRLATADDLAGVVLFLASDLARWVTGQVVLADGGLALNNRAMSPPRRPAAPAEPTAAEPIPGARVAPAEPVLPEAAAGATEPAGVRAEAAAVAPVVPGSGPSLRPVARPGGDDEEDGDAVCIVGMGIALPGANSPEEYWDVLVQGRDQMTEVPADRWDLDSFFSADRSALDKTYSRHSGFITDFRPNARLRAELADGTASREFTSMWLRHTLIDALDGVHLGGDDRVSFSVGYTADGSQHLEEALVLSGVGSRLDALVDDMVTPSRRDAARAAISRALRGRLTRALEDPAALLPHQVGLRAMAGILPADTELLMVDTACSSSLYTVDIGMKSLLLGTCDVAVCGGSFALGPRGAVLFGKLGGLSPSGTVRALDHHSDGVLFSDGAGVLVLKRLARARADGDRVLGIVGAIGSSSDGKGKAIYAPSPAGQRLAVGRALEAAGVGPDELGLAIAHATGTPAGDLAEFQNLRESIGRQGHRVLVTSNKSMVGHTGWAAGAASLIEAVLAIQHGTVPAQHNFEAPPDAFDVDGCSLEIPTEATPWPRRDDGPRVALVSGFGFGGTNATAVVEEAHPARRPSASAPRYPNEPIVVVGRAAHVPGLDGAADVDEWLAGGPAPGKSFGAQYPIPPFQRVRIPPGTLRRLDRCQLMILEAVFALEAELGEAWDRHRLTTGILAGHMGPTRTATHYALRCHLDGVRRAIDAEPELASLPELDGMWEVLTASVRALVPDSTEDSFPGIMPNVIPARVANYLDFKGLNMTVDAGFGSLLTAVETAARYLRSGDLDLALACGINGNSTGEVESVVSGMVPGGEPDVGEGAFLFALARESTAREEGLPVLGTVGEYVTGAGVDRLAADHTIRCGTSAGGRRNYLGAEGGVALFEALQGNPARTAVVCTDSHMPGGQVALVLDRRPAGHQDPRPAEPARVPATAAAVPAAPAAPRLVTSAPAAPAKAPPDRPRQEAPDLLLTRHVERLVAQPAEVVRPVLPAVPPGTVVLTNDPGALAGVELGAGSAVVSTAPVPPGRAGWHHVADVTPEAVAAVLSREPGAGRHLRLVTDLSAAEPTAALGDPPRWVTDLHDLLFLVSKERFDALAGPEGSLVAVLLGGLPGGAWHPLAGLFDGFVKCASWEMPDSLVFSLVTDAGDPREGLRQAAEEAALRRYVPVVARQGAVRKVAVLAEEAPADGSTMVAALDGTSVVVSAGGIRGITGEVLKAVAATFEPVVYVLGSNTLDGHPPELLDAPDGDLPALRAQFLRAGLAKREGTVAELNARFTRMLDARRARANLAELARYSGAERVHYLRCDLLDRGAVEAAMAGIVAAEGKVDLLIHSAGINRSASITTKQFDEYRRIRDLKVAGYHNLKHALRDHPPRIWFNFSSFVGVTGLEGEVDYASGNDFLATAAAYSRAALGRDEVTFGWTWWGSVGMASDPIKHSFLQKQGFLTQMSSAEGTYHLLEELFRPRRSAFTTHIGDVEWRSVEGRWPGTRAAWRELVAADDGPAPAGLSPALAAPPSPGPSAPRPAPDGPARSRVMLGEQVGRTATTAAFERDVDRAGDAYLLHHLVDGHPTLPGTFVPEIAAEAAMALVPHRVPVGFDDLSFHSFLRLYGERPQRMRTRAEVVTEGPVETVVRVRVTTDVVSPGGILLKADRLHFQATVRMLDRLPAAPRWEPWDAGEDIEPVPDPYHIPNRGVLLTGPFVSTADTRRHAEGRRARYVSNVPADDPVLSRMALPSVLLDGLARLCVLDTADGDWLGLAAPGHIRRIDIYELRNDIALAAAYPTLELYSTPRNLDVEDAGASNRCAAVAPDGHLVLQIHDVVGVVMGHVNRVTGEFVPTSQRRPAAAAVAAGEVLAVGR